MIINKDTVQHIAFGMSNTTSLIVMPDDIFQAGLEYAGFDHTRQAKNNERRKTTWFKAFYGVEPSTVAAVFEDVRSVSSCVTIKNLLMTMNWLFLYETYPVLSGRWKIAEETIAKQVVAIGLIIAKLSRKKIVFELEHPSKLGRTVDCVNFTSQEMRLDPSSKWYDHKSNSCGFVSYMAAVHK